MVVRAICAGCLACACPSHASLCTNTPSKPTKVSLIIMSVEMMMMPTKVTMIKDCIIIKSSKSMFSVYLSICHTFLSHLRRTCNTSQGLYSGKVHVPFHPIASGVVTIVSPQWPVESSTRWRPFVILTKLVRGNSGFSTKLATLQPWWQGKA